mgnify:FL=1
MMETEVGQTFVGDDEACRGSEVNNPHLLSQSGVYDAMRDRHDKAELLASCLKEWKLLKPKAKVTAYPNRHMAFIKFYTQTENISFCIDVPG